MGRSLGLGQSWARLGRAGLGSGQAQGPGLGGGGAGTCEGASGWGQGQGPGSTRGQGVGSGRVGSDWGQQPWVWVQRHRPPAAEAGWRPCSGSCSRPQACEGPGRWPPGPWPPLRKRPTRRSPGGRRAEHSGWRPKRVRWAEACGRRGFREGLGPSLLSAPSHRRP